MTEFLNSAAPLAPAEIDNEQAGFGDFQSSSQKQHEEDTLNANNVQVIQPSAVLRRTDADDSVQLPLLESDSDNIFKDSLSDSLEDLVSTFDDKITKCLSNFSENAEAIAPVQIRTQEELLNDCK